MAQYSGGYTPLVPQTQLDRHADANEVVGNSVMGYEFDYGGRLTSITSPTGETICRRLSW